MYNDNFSTQITEKDKKIAEKHKSAERYKSITRKEMQDFIHHWSVSKEETLQLNLERHR